MIRAGAFAGLVGGVGWLLRSILLLLPAETATAWGFSPAALSALAIALHLLLIAAVVGVYAACRDRFSMLWTLAAGAAVVGLAITVLGGLLELAGEDWAGLGVAAGAFGVIVSGAAYQALGFAWWQRKTHPTWVGWAFSILGLLVIPLIVIPPIAGLVYGAVWAVLALNTLSGSLSIVGVEGNETQS